VSAAPSSATELPLDADELTRPADSLYRKLAWLTFFRLVMVTVLLGGTAGITWSSRTGLDGAASRLYALVGATYVVSLAFAIALHRRRGLVALAYGQIALDVGIAATVVALTGFTDSVFVFMFSLGIVNGSILLFRRGAIAAALLAIATYLAIVIGMSPAAPKEIHWGAVFVHTSAFALTAALSSYLAEQLRRTGERLAAREGDLAAITAIHEAIVQSVASGLLTLDGDRRITFINRAGEQMTGLSAAEILGRPGDTWFSAFDAQTRRDETDFVNVRGERLRVGFAVFPLRGRDGRDIGTAVIFQDLTQLRALEEAVQRSERLADLGQLAAGLAHELRNPLASMCGSVEILKSSASLAEQERRLMEIVLREAERLNHLVTRFLEFTRPAPPRRAQVDLSRIVEHTLEVFSHDPGAARVRIERSLVPATVACDADQMRQVFWNLLANAAQACGAHAGEDRVGTIRVSCSPAADGVALIVQDDGPGIPPQNVQRIFTPFFTTKQQGTGLGLATVQRIVDAHGGTIVVESSPGCGAKFAVHIPAHVPPLSAVG
jgi:two-component system, NtrC family, sensor histidine kinase PilS